MTPKKSSTITAAAGVHAPPSPRSPADVPAAAPVPEVDHLHNTVKKEAPATFFEVTVYLEPQKYIVAAETAEQAGMLATEQFGSFGDIDIEDIQVVPKPADPDACAEHTCAWKEDCPACSNKLRERVEADFIASYDENLGDDLS